VIAVEPFLSTRSTSVTEGPDGWTLVGQPGNLSAQYEHTIIVTRGAPITVTTHCRSPEESLLPAARSVELGAVIRLRVCAARAPRDRFDAVENRGPERALRSDCRERCTRLALRGREALSFGEHVREVVAGRGVARIDR